MIDLNKVEVDYTVEMLSSGVLCDEASDVFLRHLEELLSYRREALVANNNQKMIDSLDDILSASVSNLSKLSNLSSPTQTMSPSGIDAASKGNEKINLLRW